MDRTQKEALVASFNEAFSGATLVVVASQKGLSVAQSTELRREMRSAGANFKVTKNRLTRLALKGTKFEHLSALFTGPTGIAYSNDPVAAARIAVKFVVLDQADRAAHARKARRALCRRLSVGRRLESHRRMDETAAARRDAP